MDTIEKRDFIHRYLHKADEELLNEMYDKIFSLFKGHEIEMNDELKDALDSSIKSLDQWKGIPHEEAMANMKKKFSHLNFEWCVE